MMAIVAPPWSVLVWRHCGTSRRGGQIQTVLIYSPDRLSRKYAYQVLLAEELARCGVELIFLRAPSGATAEDQLLVQFQGMIAEYERAQIAERSRRGKRHRAQQGSINVLSGAPYGYRYVKKTDTSAAYYEVVESEAEVVRLIFDAYTRQGLSIGAIAGSLNQREVPTRTRQSRWERPTIWRMLHNPAYAGRAFYGKTELRPRRRITRRVRQRGLCSRDSSFRERPRPEWIEIPVPALVSEVTFALAQEQFEKNKRFSPRRTLEPSNRDAVDQRKRLWVFREHGREGTRDNVSEPLIVPSVLGVANEGCKLPIEFVHTRGLLSMRTISRYAAWVRSILSERTGRSVSATINRTTPRSTITVAAVTI